MTIVFEDNQMKIHHESCQQTDYTEADLIACKNQCIATRTKVQEAIDLIDYWITQIQSK